MQETDWVAQRRRITGEHKRKKTVNTGVILVDKTVFLEARNGWNLMGKRGIWSISADPNEEGNWVGGNVKWVQTIWVDYISFILVN